MSERMTAVFDYDVRKFPTNPHQTDTPFGKAVCISRGDLCKKVDDIRVHRNALSAALREAIRALDCDGDMVAALDTARAALAAHGEPE